MNDDDIIILQTTSLVPYTGATKDVDLGSHNLTTTGTVTGQNVTSGADPGHTHTAYQDKLTYDTDYKAYLITS